MTYLLAINCGSSSIKAKLYKVPSEKSQALSDVASLNVSNINAKGEKIKIKVSWAEGVSGKDVDVEGEDGDKVERELTSGCAD
jgi:acetate kinase